MTSFDSDRAALATAVHVTGDGRRFQPILAALPSAPGSIFVGGDRADSSWCAESVAEYVQVETAAGLLRHVMARHDGHVLLIGEPVLGPGKWIEPALALLAAEPRIGTISFWSNAAGYLSLPFWNQRAPMPPNDHDASTLTDRLRSLLPEPDPVPIPVAIGGAVLISSSLLGVLHESEIEGPPDGGFAAIVANVSLAGRRRGFLDVLDPGTFITHSSDLARTDETGALDSAALSWVIDRHPFLPAILAEEAASTGSPSTLAHRVARAKITGLRILLDGSCLGPTEMGTQVGVVQLADAFSADGGVSHTTLVIPGPLPDYAAHLFNRPRVRLINDAQLQGEETGFDIAYRAFQPDAHFDVARWRERSHRVAVGMLDLIAYQNGSYHPTGDAWRAYRVMIREQVARVDGVSTISRDVKHMLHFERLPIEERRVFAVPYGTEHLSHLADIATPPTLVERQRVERRFIVCIGTNYSHKNRDLAIRSHAELLRRGHSLDLVLMGPSVPHGSSRMHEFLALDDHPSGDVIVLPALTSAERNWVLQHAEAVIYPTSAEGFGLVPFEAAWLGTPAVYVPFGPLQEIGGDVAVAAADWRPKSVADATERLLADPDLASRQIDSLITSGSSFTWANTASSLVEMFRYLLNLPSR